MRRTAVLTLEYPPFKGGVGRFASTVYRSLDPAHRYLVLPKGTKGDESNADYIRYFSKWIWPSWLPLLFSLRSYIRKHSIEQLILFNLLPLGTVAYLYSLVFQIQYIVSIHGLDLINARQSFLKRFLAKKILLRSDSIIAISDYVKHQLLAFGIPEYKICLLHPLPYVTPKSTQPQPIPNVSESLVQRSFVSVGRLVPRKNFLTLVEVAYQAKKKRIPFQCIIVGEGPQKKILTDEIRKKEVGDHVQIFDACTDNQLAWLYSHCLGTFFVPHSDGKDAEGFGIVCSESSAFGKPVIASNQGGVRDAVESSVNGILVNPLSVDEILHAVQAITSMPALRTLLGRGGKEKIKNETAFFGKALSCLSGQLTQSEISVVIPMFNAEDTIISTIETLFSQTLPPKEILIVNDGSTDGSLQLAKQYSDTCVILTQKNAGAPSARNLGASKANGRFLLFVDADMLLHPSMLEIMNRTLFFSPQASWTYATFLFGKKKFKALPFSLERLQKHNYIHTSSLLRKSDFFGFDPNLKRHQDWDLWLTLAKKGKIGIPISLLLYSIILKQGRISKWVPSFFYSIPGINLISRNMKSYEESSRIIRQKHNIH